MLSCIGTVLDLGVRHYKVENEKLTNLFIISEASVGFKQIVFVASIQ